MNESVDHLQINGQARPINELFSPSRSFTVEYYQREYAWQRVQVEELVNDLARSFLSTHSHEHLRSQVSGYPPYFLGPIITYTSSAVSFLVDGQQRVTTLALLLLYLRSKSNDEEQRTSLSSLVYSTSYGTASFRMRVEDRDAVMKAILDDTQIQLEKLDTSSSNIWNRYRELDEVFPEELLGDVLPYFVDWIQNRVILVEISTPDKNMALEIFESMNDRGLRLTSMDMLKSYVLSRILDPLKIEKANDSWREVTGMLSELQKNGETEFMKTLLRAKFAQTARETGKGSTPKHFEDIGTAFHKWVREQSEANDPAAGKYGAMPLIRAEGFEAFVMNEMPVHARRYAKMLSVSQQLTRGWEHTYYNAKNNFTLQYLLGLAVSEVTDDEETFRRKFELVAKYIDLMVARRMVNFKRRGYSMMYRPMFALARSIRGKTLEELREILSEKAHALEETFDAINGYVLTNMNKPDVFYLLARMTAWLEDDISDKFFNGLTNTDPFEVEHIWANKFERHVEEFLTENEFAQARNQFGALVLLPKSFNASYGALPYSKKAPLYRKQNQLVQTVVDGSGRHNPRLSGNVTQHGIDLVGFETSFSRDDITVRQEFYRQLCEVIWSHDELGL